MEKIRTIGGYELRIEESNGIISVCLVKWNGFEHKMYTAYILKSGTTFGYIHTETPIKGGEMHYHETMSNRMIDKVISLVVK